MPTAGERDRPTEATSPAPVLGLVAERYELRALVGETSKSAVFSARDRDTSTDVCVKILKPQSFRTDVEAKHRFRREGELLASLRHGNVVKVLDMGEDPSGPFLVMELIPGTTLEDAIVENGLSIDHALRVLVQVADGLSHVHRSGVVHRDLKPGNILMAGEASTEEVRIIDFGFAELAFDEEQARHEVAGTFHYMAPEQLGLIESPVGPRADLYAVGCIAYECLAGAPPFAADELGALLGMIQSELPSPLRSRVPDLPPALDRIIGKLLAKSPEDRYQSAEGLAADLARVLEDYSAGRPTQTFELDRLSRSSLAGLGSVFVGRESELDDAGRAIDALEHDGVQMLLVGGRSGVGKTAFVRSVINRAKSNALRVLRGKSNPVQTSFPYYPVAELLGEAHNQLLRNPDAAEALEELTSVLGELAGELVRVAPAWRASMPNAPVLDYGGVDEERDRLIFVLEKVLTALTAGGRAIALFLDDLQWADRGTLHLIGELPARLGRLPVLIIGTYRSEEVAVGHGVDALRQLADDGLASVIHLELMPLSLEETGDLLDTLFGVRPVELAQILHERAEGNAFFICELLRAFAQAQAIELAADGLRVDPERIARIRLPSELVDLVLHRIDTLSVDARRILGVGALAGRNFDFPLVVRGAAVEPEPAYDALSECVGARLVDRVHVANQHGYAFVHDKVLEACAQIIVGDERTHAHARIAHYLESTWDGEAQERVHELAHHYHAGKQNERAIHFCTLAGDQARALHVNEQALEMYQMVENLLGEEGVEEDDPRRIRTLVHQAEAHDAMGNYERAEKLYRDALRLSTDPIEIADYLTKIAYSKQKMGAYDASKAHLFEALGLLGVRLPFAGLRLRLGRYLARLRYWAVGWWLRLRSPETPPMPSRREALVMEIFQRLYMFYLMTDVARIDYLAYRFLAMAMPFTASRELAEAHRLMAITVPQAPNPRYAKAVAHAFRAIEVARSIGARPELAAAYSVLGGLECWRVRPRDAMTYLERAQEMLERVGNRWLLVNTHIFFFMAFKAIGKLDDALSQALNIVRIGERATAAGSISAGCARAGDILLLKGERGAGFDYLERALAVATEHNLTFDTYVARKFLGTHLMREKRFAQAREHWEEAIRLNERPGTSFMRVYVHDSYIGWAESVLRDEEWLARATTETRRDVLALVRERLELSIRKERAYRMNLPYALIVSARLARRNGDQVAMNRLLEEARGIVESEKRTFEEAVVLGHQAELLAETQPDVARFCHNAAIKSYSAMGAQGEVMRLKSLARKRGANDEALEGDAEHGAGSRAQKQLRSLLMVSRVIGSSLELEEVMAKIVDQSVALLGAERGFLLLCPADDEGQTDFVVRLAHTADGNGIPEREQQISRSVIEKVSAERQALVVTDALADERFAAKESVVASNLRSVVCAPLIHQDRLYGVVYLDNRLVEQVFGPRDAELLSHFAGQAAIILANAEAYTQLRRMNEGLEEKVRDRTQLLESAQERLVMSEKLASVGQLVAGLAHEINNPVNFIYGNMTFLKEYVNAFVALDDGTRRLSLPEDAVAELARLRTDLGIEEARGDLGSLVEAVEDGAQRISVIVKNLLSFARGQSDGKEEASEVEINRRLDAAIQLLGRENLDRIHIEREYAPGCQIVGFAASLDQALLNLLVNACHAIEGTGEIRVRTRWIGDTAEVDVEDTGCGIPEANLRKIFDPFFTTKAVGKGTGLGLSLVFSTLQRHGGEVKVASTVGKGTCFTLRIPKRPAAEAAAEGAAV